MRDRLVQLIALVSAVALTLYFDAGGQIRNQLGKYPSMASYVAYFDAKNVVAIMTPLVYVVLSILLFLCYSFYPVRWIFDRANIRCRGRYISWPITMPEEINIFDVKPSRFSTSYTLTGESFKLKGPLPATCIGHWSSSDVKVNEGVLKYVYTGTKISEGQTSTESEGVACVSLVGEARNLGKGYWLDAKSGPVRVDSRYARVTKGVRNKLVADRHFLYRQRCRFYWPRRAIADACITHSRELQTLIFVSFTSLMPGTPDPAADTTVGA